MRTFLGMVLGCLLTIGFVYIHEFNGDIDSGQRRIGRDVASDRELGCCRQRVGAGEGECPHNMAQADREQRLIPTSPVCCECRRRCRPSCLTQTSVVFFSNIRVARERIVA